MCLDYEYVCFEKICLDSKFVSFNPRGDQEQFSVAYCSYKSHNFANIGHKNINFNAKRISVEQTKIMVIFVFEKI